MLKIHIHTQFSKTKCSICLHQPAYADKLWIFTSAQHQIEHNTSKQHTLNSGMAHTAVAPITLQKNTSALL